MRFLNLLAAFLFATICFLWHDATAADLKIAELNNQGVRALNAGRFLESMRLFEEALRRSPQYPLARQNLLIALKECALRLQPERAAGYFRKLLSINPQDEVANGHLARTLTSLRRRKLRERLTPEDIAVLYTNFPKLNSAPQHGAAALKSRASQSGAFVTAFGEKAPSGDRSYMTRVEQVIRSTWKPPKTDSKIIIKYAFNLNKFGSLSGLRLIKSGGEPLADAAALDALKAACFPESPDNAPDVISIEFTFEQNMGPKGPSLDDKRALITGFSALVGKENTAANYSWLAGAYELNGDKELAMQAYKKALEIDPNYSVAKYGINRLDKDVRDAGTPAQ